jgi:hypothetical protein
MKCAQRLELKPRERRKNAAHSLPWETYFECKTIPGGAKEDCDTNSIDAIRPANFPGHCHKA